MSYPQKTFTATTFADGSFWKRRRDIVRSTTLLYQLDMLKRTGRYDAFKLKWHPSYSDPPTHWPVPNHLFWDSDVAKWIEGACYFLHDAADAAVDAAVTELVEMIRGAAQPDGYINIHFTVVAKGQRFTNLRDLHELYNAGHMVEAAVAHAAHYKNYSLLEPISRYVRLLADRFGPREGQKHGYPGHPEIELALLRLFEHSKDSHHYDLAKYFIEERGKSDGQDGRHFFEVEAEMRGERENEMPRYYPEKKSYWYQQAHQPIVEQKEIKGHAVRAMYLLTAVADLVRIDGKDADPYREALIRLWRNMVDKKMYMTGGIGAIKQWEGFGIDYFLPQGTDEGGCYSETCASIGVVMLAERLLKLELDGEYADIMELCLYNTVLTGMSYNGKEFTYVNQLASSGDDLSKREEWFECACCPPNVTRLFGSIGGYVWSYDIEDDQKSATVAVHLYTAATLSFSVAGTEVQIKQTTEWPLDGDVEFSITTSASLNIKLALRIPGWAEVFELSPHPKEVDWREGYVHLPNDYVMANPSFTLSIPLKPRPIAPHPYTNQPIVAVARGPLIYCVEDIDNTWVDDHFKSVLFDPTVALQERRIRDYATKEMFIRIVAPNGAQFLNNNDRNVPFDSPVTGIGTTKRDLNFVPYYFRANRGGKGHMRVGLRTASQFEVKEEQEMDPPSEDEEKE